MMLQGVLALTALLGGAWILWRWNTRKTRVVVDASPPADFPAAVFSHATFEQLLREFVVAGKVDYERWHRDAESLQKLDSYLAALASFGPQTTPDRFVEETDALAYWMYAYNAFVIKAILERWPLKSVTDVKAPVELVKGLGFFHTLHFLADGRWRTLYAIEKDLVVGDREDPRVHFVLNCGSEACPAIRPELPAGADLESMLDDAAREFVGDPRNVAIDHDSKTVRLSAIFKMYEREFQADLIRRGIPSDRGILDYLTAAAPQGLRTELADLTDYRVTYHDYDWSLNKADVA